MNPTDESLLRGIVESMDWCDPTRAHEARPSHRLRMQHQLRRATRIVVCCLVSAAVALTTAAFFAH